MPYYGLENNRRPGGKYWQSGSLLPDHIRMLRLTYEYGAIRYI